MLVKNKIKPSYTPLVSVCLITYNHESFISEAIEGVLNQEISFEIEIIIGEDCSTDQTRAICEQYQQKYPGVITLLQKSKNLGMVGNFSQTLRACRGKYIAICEGDDYWTNQNKLSLQIQVLESKPQYSGCIHYGDIVDSEGNFKKKSKKPQVNFRNERHLIHALEEGKSSWVTCSLIFRRELIISNSFYIFLEEKKLNCDQVFDVWLTKHGPLIYLEENLSSHRHHQGGIWSSKDNNSIDSLEYLLKGKIFLLSQKGFNLEEKKIINLHVIKLSNKLLKKIVENKTFTSKIFFTCFKIQFMNKIKEFLHLVKKAK